MKPKMTHAHFLNFFTGGFPPPVFCVSVIRGRVDSHPDCAPYFVRQTFEGGVALPAHGVTRIRTDEGGIEIVYLNFAFYGKVRCRP